MRIEVRGHDGASVTMTPEAHNYQHRLDRGNAMATAIVLAARAATDALSDHGLSPQYEEAYRAFLVAIDALRDAHAKLASELAWKDGVR